MINNLKNQGVNAKLLEKVEKEVSNFNIDSEYTYRIPNNEIGPSLNVTWLSIKVSEPIN